MMMLLYVSRSQAHSFVSFSVSTSKPLRRSKKSSKRSSRQSSRAITRPSSPDIDIGKRPSPPPPLATIEDGSIENAPRAMPLDIILKNASESRRASRRASRQASKSNSRRPSVTWSRRNGNVGEDLFERSENVEKDGSTITRQRRSFSSNMIQLEPIMATPKHLKLEEEEIRRGFDDE